MLKKFSRAIEDMPISTLVLRKFLRGRGKQILIDSMLKKFPGAIGNMFISTPILRKIFKRW
jgi:hypothetical protein